MHRREYLALTGATVAAGLAGCPGMGDGADDGEPTTTESLLTIDVPAWAEWLPAEPVTAGSGEAFTLDIQRASEEFPQRNYEEFSIPQISELYGVDEGAMDYLTGVQRPTAEDLSLLTGTFDPEEIRTNLGVAESETESYRGYTILEDRLAVGETAIIVNQYREALDTKFGDTNAIAAADEDWQRLLTAVSDGTLAGVTSGSLGDGQTSFDVERSGITIDAAGDGRALLTAHLMFDSPSRAEEVLDEKRQEILDSTSDGDGSLQSIELEGKRIVVAFETDSFDF